ncbi:hypothetical protein BASA81_007593 [Batrachochytrium salamandrivorans]|nr:hypothetical protein BASA81_007593 [Batrachochytrium salamandrivorans]
MELLRAALADPQASKICSLVWLYDGKQDVNSIIPLLINNCPDLASLEVEFEHHSEFDFVSSLLEHPSNRIKLCTEYLDPKGLAGEGWEVRGPQSSHRQELEYVACQVQLASSTKVDLWCEFISPDRISQVRHQVRTGQPARFADGFDWSFLAGSMCESWDSSQKRKGVDWKSLGDALGCLLEGKRGWDELRFGTFATLSRRLWAAVGVEVGRIKSLNVLYADLNDCLH